MGIAASLFFSTTDKENCLDWRIRPSDEQYDSQKERWNDLADHLHDDLAKRSDCPMYSWLQGSYKFGTQVRPPSPENEFDIDLGMYFRWEGDPDDGKHSPVDLKNFVQESLIQYADDETNDASSVDDLRAKCSRIHFDDGFHIDVPAYHLDPDQDARALATDKNEWEDSDPKAIYGWWKTVTEKDRARFRRLVRYFKMWAALKIDEDNRPSSILLTVLTGNVIEKLDTEKLTGDDEYFRACISAIDEKLQKSSKVPNPVNKFENLNRLSSEGSDALVKHFQELLDIADRALAAKTKTASSDIWSEAFDHFFPVPAEDDAEEAVLKLAEDSRALAAIAFNPIVEVRAQVGGRTFTGIDKIGPIPKGCDITFTLANYHALPPGSEVNWMVRNAGKDAEDANDLGHRVGRGRTAERDSAYRGTHFMDLTIKSNGVLLGSKRIPVTVTGLGIPKRNSPRPAWTKLRRK